MKAYNSRNDSGNKTELVNPTYRRRTEDCESKMGRGEVRMPRIRTERREEDDKGGKEGMIMNSVTIKR